MSGLAAKPVITGVDVDDADTEYSITVPAGARRFEFRYRAAIDLRYAYVTGKVATPTDPYKTLVAQATHDSGEITISSDLVIFFAAGTGSSRVELEYWT